MMATRLLGGTVVAATCLFGAEAQAQLRADWGVNRATQEDWDGGYDTKAERRSGFTVGTSLTLGMVSLTGYPNEIEKFDRAEYRTATGSTLGSTNFLWLGGALRDWFVFGLGLWSLGATKDDIEATGGGFFVRVETFPLWSLGGRLRDVSVYTNVGLGGLTIKGGPEEADGGLMSMLGLGVSYEVLRLKYFALGPTLEGVYTYSQSAQGGGAFLGVKGAIYAGP